MKGSAKMPTIKFHQPEDFTAPASPRPCQMGNGRQTEKQKKKKKQQGGQREGYAEESWEKEEHLRKLKVFFKPQYVPRGKRMVKLHYRNYNDKQRMLASYSFCQYTWHIEQCYLRIILVGVVASPIEPYCPCLNVLQVTCKIL